MKFARFALFAALPFIAGTAQAASVAMSVVGGTNAVLPGSFSLDDTQNGAGGWSLAAYQALVPAGVAYNGSAVKVISGADRKSVV